ncbi:MAG: hypothetical protein ACREO1_02465 [Arenimonas sp.]
MKKTQLSKGENRRLMYVENKHGDIDGAAARIGWVTFSKSGMAVHYRNRLLSRLKGGGISGNYFDQETGEEYWVSGVKTSGSNSHHGQHLVLVIDEDAKAAYEELRNPAKPIDPGKS